MIIVRVLAVWVRSSVTSNMTIATQHTRSRMESPRYFAVCCACLSLSVCESDLFVTPLSKTRPGVYLVFALPGKF